MTTPTNHRKERGAWVHGDTVDYGERDTRMPYSDWGDVFRAALRRGDDHGYAAYIADRWQERKAVRIFDQLRKCLELESEAHTLWDDAFSNVCHGKLSREMRDGYIEKTYKATRLHAEAQQTLRELAKELNGVLGTGYHLD